MNYQTKAVELTEKLMAINSYQHQGKVEIIQLVKNLLIAETQAEISINDVISPSLIAVLKGKDSSFSLLLEGHLDVVNAKDDMFKPVLADDVLYGRGAVDMKSGCAAIIYAFIAASKATHRQHDLYLVLTTDEETTGATIKYLLENGMVKKTSFAMIPEPTDLQICNAHKGEAWISLEFFGKAAHSSMPELGVNAIYMASDFIQILRKNSLGYTAHPFYGKETLSVGVIEGGNSPNVVPERAKIRIDKRYLPHQSIDNTIKEMQIAIAECQQQNAHFNSKMTIEGDWSALYTDPEQPIFKQIKALISNTLLQNTQLIFWTAWGEGGYINQFGVPTLYFGPGDTKLAHTINEKIHIQDIEKATCAYIAIIKALIIKNENNNATNLI